MSLEKINNRIIMIQEILFPKMFMVVNLFFLYVIPLFVTSIFLVSIYIDKTSATVKIASFFPFLILSFFQPLWAFYALISSLCYWEIPTLMLGYSNQFIFEYAVLGFILSHSIQDIHKKRCINVIRDNEFAVQKLLFFPFFYVLLFSVIFGLISSITSLNEIFRININEYDLHLFFRSFFTYIFRWEVRSPFHHLSIVIGYCLLLSLLFRTIIFQKLYKIEGKTIIYIIVLGSIPIFTMAYVQHFFPDELMTGFLSIFKNKDEVGTFQNGNHLSFFAGLVIILGFFSFSDYTTNKKRKKNIIFATCYAVLPMLYGNGRSSWAGLFLVFLFTILYWTLKTVIQKKFNRFFLVLLLVSVIGLYLDYSLNNIIGFGSICSLDFLKPKCYLIEEVMISHQVYGLKGIFLYGGRAENIIAGLEAISLKPFIGHSIGSFWNHSFQHLDLHNQLLNLWYDFGAFGLIFLAVGVLLFGLISLNSNIQIFWRGASILLYSMVVLQFDVIFNYRSILAVFSISLLAVTSLIKSQNSKYKKISKQLLIITLFCALFLGGLTILYPKTIPSLVQNFPTELEQESGKTFSWNGPFYHIYLEPGFCKQMNIKPYSPDHEEVNFVLNKLEFSHQVTYFLDISTVKRNKDKNFIKSNIILVGNSWNTVCFCRVPSIESKSSLYGLFRENGFYPDWAIGNGDLRFLSYMVSDVIKYPYSEEKIIENHCSKINY